MLSVSLVNECWRWRLSVSGSGISAAGTVTLVLSTDRTFSVDQQSQRRTGARQSWWTHRGRTATVTEGPLDASEGWKTRTFKRHIRIFTLLLVLLYLKVFRRLMLWFIPGKVMHQGGWRAAGGVCCCPLLTRRANWHFLWPILASPCVAWMTEWAGRAARRTHSPVGWRENVVTNEEAAAKSLSGKDFNGKKQQQKNVPVVTWSIQHCAVNEEGCRVCFPCCQRSWALHHSDREKKP